MDVYGAPPSRVHPHVTPFLRAMPRGAVCPTLNKEAMYHMSVLGEMSWVALPSVGNAKGLQI